MPPGHVLSALVAAGCVLASACRLAWAVSPTGLDPALLLKALNETGPTGFSTELRRALLATDGTAWERDFLAALACEDDELRVALVNEQLGELDWLVRRWERVPRVCASVATSAAFLFACVTLTGAGATGDADMRATLVAAVDTLAIGIAAAAFCVAVHVRAPRIVRARLGATDRLVERLQGRRLAPATSSQSSGEGPSAGSSR